MPYRHLLRGNGPAVLAFGFLARLPYAMTSLATLVLLRSATGSFAFAGAATGAQSLAIGAGGVAIGRLTEWFGLRRLGVLAAVANAMAIAGLIAATRAGHAVMVIAAVLVGLTQPQVGPLLRVHWSRRARSRQDAVEFLAAALSYETAADEVGFVAGPSAVGLLAGVTTSVPGAAPLLAGIVLLTVAAVPLAVLYAKAPTPSADDRPDDTRIPVVPMALMLAAMILMGGIFGALQTGVTAYAQQAAAPSAAGWLYAELGLGSALAGLACGWLPRRFGFPSRYRVFSISLLIGMSGALLLPLPVGIIVAGVAIAPYMISIYALSERLAPGRVATTMTIVCAGGPVGTAAGQIVSGLFVDQHGYSGAIALAPVLAGLAAVLGAAFPALTRLAGPRPTPVAPATTVSEHSGA